MSKAKSPSRSSSRREFLGRTAATVASVSLFRGAGGRDAAAQRVPAVKGRIPGANDRIRLGSIGCGMQYCINMVSGMGNATSAPISVYGNWGTLQVLPPERPTPAQRANQAPRGGPS